MKSFLIFAVVGVSAEIQRGMNHAKGFLISASGAVLSALTITSLATCHWEDYEHISGNSTDLISV